MDGHDRYSGGSAYRLTQREWTPPGRAASVVAVNEAVARFQLGGIWKDVERAAAWTPTEIDGLPEIYRHTEADV